MTAVTAAPRSSSTLPWASWALLLVIGAIALKPLTPTWNDDPNYSFGWLIPFVSLFLLFERWPSRPARQASPTVRLVPIFIAWGLIFFAFRLASEADPDWRPGLWVIVGLYLAVILGWLWLFGGVSWMRHFAFPIGFLALCLPWFFQIEYPLVQGLMRWNAARVADSLNLLGIDAIPAGNIIHLQNCQLGVEEACSGILSLQASLMMGCLLGEIYRLTPRRRVFLVIASMVLALVGNYFRTLFLALMAFYVGPDAVPRWHDTAGYSILVFTGVGSWLVALAWAGEHLAPEAPAASQLSPRDEMRQAGLAQRLVLGIFLVALITEGATQAWFNWRESKLVRHPDWVLQWPKTEKVHDVPLSAQTRQALRCDDAKTGEWLDAHGWKWGAYWLRYEPKPYTRVVLGWHTPDHCLPSVGLVKDRDYPSFTAEANGISLYVRPKKFLLGQIPIYIFWVVYPTSGELEQETDTRIAQPLATKFTGHLQDVMKGYRGVGVETLETSIIGCPDYETAKAAYLAGLKDMVFPVVSASAQGTSHP